jgi:hypothetical protein
MTDERTLSVNPTKQLTKAILEHADSFDWTLQGLGMLRTYLSLEVRLHVWHSGFKFKEGDQIASELHTHPWNFHSLVVAGRVRNYRFLEVAGTSLGTGQAIPRKRQTIRCGEGGGLIGDPVDVFLAEQPTETFEEGETYTQKAEEIHRSLPDDGTVTIIEREFLDDTEHAFVYFRGEWISAEPRPATPEEVAEITGFALQTRFG